MNSSQIITELADLGLKQIEIAQRIGKSQAWVSDVLRGRYSDLKYSDCKALIELHKKEMRKRKKETASRC